MCGTEGHLSEGCPRISTLHAAGSCLRGRERCRWRVKALAGAPSCQAAGSSTQPSLPPSRWLGPGGGGVIVSYKVLEQQILLMLLFDDLHRKIWILRKDCCLRNSVLTGRKSHLYWEIGSCSCMPSPSLSPGPSAAAWLPAS